MKSNTSLPASAPLVPLVAPSGVTGVAALPFPDRSIVKSEDGFTGALRLTGRDITGNPLYVFTFKDSVGNRCHRNLTCPNHYGHYSPIPASPVKDTPADPLEGLNEDEIGLRHAQSWSKAGIPDLGAHLDAPASPVDSVGVPESNPYDLGLDLPLVWALTDSGSVMHDQQAVIMDAPGFKLAECSIEFARAACRGLNGSASHAAKDAKIRAMELALQTASQCIQEFFTMGESEDALALRKVFFTHRETALALPCA